MNSMKWIISILLALLIWPLVFILLVIGLELLLTIGLIVVLAYAIKAGLE